ncbi:MAG: DUF4135 domain-containing protein [Caldilineaceae bacterium]
MVSRTLVLEMHVARLEGKLPGESPEARFQSYLQRLQKPANALAILTEYPVLARQLTLLVEQWVQSSVEFVARLCADWGEICAPPSGRTTNIRQLHRR